MNSMNFLLDEIDSVLSPIGGSGRVKYSCIDVSKRYLVLGANTGSLYFFEKKSLSSFISKPTATDNNSNHQHQHQQQQQQQQNYNRILIERFTNDNLSFTQILSLNDIRDSISLIKINPYNDNLIAIATHKTLYVIEPNISIRREKEKIVIKMTDHPKDAEITSIVWSQCGQYLFSSDDLGNVFCCSIVKARKAFFFSAESIYKCDSKVVQLDIIPTLPISILQQQQLQQAQQPHIETTSNSNTTPQHQQQQQAGMVATIALLTSTLTKTTVVNFQISPSSSAKLLSAIQIGKKLRENTKQGSCFHPLFKSSIYASRPGKRIWLADPSDGRVLSTMNFSGEGGAPVIKPKPFSSDVNAPAVSGPMVFSKLLPFGRSLISWDEKSLLLIDVNEVEVLDWRIDPNQIFDLSILGDSIYVLHGQNRTVTRVYSSLPMEFIPLPDLELTNNNTVNDNQNNIIDQTHQNGSTQVQPPREESVIVDVVKPKHEEEVIPTAKNPIPIVEEVKPDIVVENNTTATTTDNNNIEQTATTNDDLVQLQQQLPKKEEEVEAITTPSTPATELDTVSTSESTSKDLENVSSLPTPTPTTEITESKETKETKETIENTQSTETLIEETPIEVTPIPTTKSENGIEIVKDTEQSSQNQQQSIILDSSIETSSNTIETNNLNEEKLNNININPDSSNTTTDSQISEPSISLSNSTSSLLADETLSNLDDSTLTNNNNNNTTHIETTTPSLPQTTNISTTTTTVTPIVVQPSPQPQSTPSPQPITNTTVTPIVVQPSPPQTNLTTAPVQQQPISNSTNQTTTSNHPRSYSKENLFSDIQLSTAPLISRDPPPPSNTVTKKIIKKKKVKAADPGSTLSSSPTPTISTSPSGTTTSNTTVPKSSESTTITKSKSDLQLFDEPTPTTTTTPTTTPKTGEKRTVIIKKKIIKKAVVSPTTPPLSSTGSTSSTPTTTPPTTPTTQPKESHEVSSGTTTSQPSTPSQQSSPQKSNEPTLTTTTTTTTTNTSSNTTTNPTTIDTTTTNPTPTSNIQGIFSRTINQATSIKQLASKIQKQTSEIKAEFTQKIQSFSTIATQSVGLPTDSTSATTTTPAIDTPSSTTPNTPTTPTSNDIDTSLSTTPNIPVEPSLIEILEKYTKVTHESLIVYKYKKNEMAFLPMLQIWISTFHKLDYVPPSEQINDILTSCFMMGINLVLDEPSGKLCRCWDEGNAREYIRKFFSYLDPNTLYPHLNECQWDSCIDVLLEMESFTKQESKVISTLNQFIDNSDGNSCLLFLESHTNEYGLFFRYIDNLLELNPLPSALFYAKQYPVILPRNIFKFTDRDLSSRLPIKLEYLNHLMSLKPECKYDSFLVGQWFLCNISLNLDPLKKDLLFINLPTTITTTLNLPTTYSSPSIPSSPSTTPTPTSTTELRIPKLKSHNIEWKCRDTLVSIINNVISNEYFGNIEDLERICLSKGFFDGLFIIYLHFFKCYSPQSITSNPKLAYSYAKKLIDLTTFTDNIQGFTKFLENNTNIEYWSMALDSMLQIRVIYQQESSSPQEFDISEPFIAQMMGRAIGPLQTIELICSSKLFETQKISSTILSEWIRHGKWSLYNRPKLSYDILSGLDSHLWLKKPLTLSPQILSLIGPEIDKSLPKHPFTNKLTNEKGESVGFGVTPQFFEDNARRHWGVETELQGGSCPICTLPLLENPESSFLGSTPATIIVFPNCGHSYHQCCIEEQGCTLCFSLKR
eukprot:gene2021-2488_t